MKSHENFRFINLGKLEDLMEHSYKTPALPKPIEGKKFLKDDLGMTGMEVSLNKLEPGAGMPFHHRHGENEEFYFFIKGKGEFQVDNEIFPVGEGTALKIDPDGVRIWRNNSTEPLYFIVVQAKAGSLNKGTISDGKMVKKEIVW